MQLQQPHLPIIGTSEQAVALAEQHNDPFYLAAVKIQVWICDLLAQAMAEYAEKPDPADRLMQTGQAWRAFQPDFGRVRDEEFHYVIHFLTRYSEYENSVSTQLRRALLPVYREHELSGDFLGPKSPDLFHQPLPDVRLLYRFVERVCDWLDAVVHINTHILWVHHPACFDPDPEKRRLAGDQLIQPCTAEMDEPAVVLPYLQPRAATSAPQSVERSDHGSRKRTSPTGESNSWRPWEGSIPTCRDTPHSTPRPWPFAKLDEAIITVWPLLKLHNWTYADLWSVLSHAGLPLASTPCPDHRRLAHYCLHTLGLRKSGRGQTSRHSLPPGHELALRFLRGGSRRSPPLGRGPWS